jgi:mono/diheme cytochrome c family protein
MGCTEPPGDVYSRVPMTRETRAAAAVLVSILAAAGSAVGLADKPASPAADTREPKAGSGGDDSARPAYPVVARPAARRAGDEVEARPDETPIADDAVLMELLTDAIELRRREDFDRMLDARDTGELIEHATLNDTHFEYRTIDKDTLFIVGDELFGYLFRPENGWGGGAREESDYEFTPKPSRIHNGDAGGPDAFACANCHSKGGPDGAGTQSQNAFLRGDGKSTHGADQRNPPHVLGLGPVELLAREMSRELRGQVDAARARARDERRRVEQPLSAKGVSFGTVVAAADGTLDLSGVAGVDPDLVVKPFGWKGHHATLRGIVEESAAIHQGLLSNRLMMDVKEGRVAKTPYGDGPWYDIDNDNVSLEIDSGMLTTVVGYLSQLEVPVVRPPKDPTLVDMFAAGRAKFSEIGCASCHVPTLELRDPNFDAAEGSITGKKPYVINVAKDGDGPKVEPKFASEATPYLVHLFSDLRRHDMGEDLASSSPQGTISARDFLTRPLWGLAETAPYLHDGRAPTIHYAITLHGGEASAARDAYVALGEHDSASLRVFLASLSRQPKLFVP